MWEGGMKRTGRLALGLSERVLRATPRATGARGEVEKRRGREEEREEGKAEEEVTQEDWKGERVGRRKILGDEEE